jgi:hypothetical protein
LEQAADLFYEHDNIAVAAATLILLGTTHLEMGNKSQAAACFYDALQKSSAVHALPVTVDALIEIALLLLDAAEPVTAFNILRAVQSQPVTTQGQRLRIDGILANMGQTSLATNGNDGETPDDLQHAIALVLRAENLLRKK